MTLGADHRRDRRRRRWLTGRRCSPSGAAIRASEPYLSGRDRHRRVRLLFALLRLLFAPDGWFSTIDGVPDDGRSPLPRRRQPDRPGAVRSARADRRARRSRSSSASLVWTWARRGDNARLFPVWVGGLTTGIVAAAISAPIAAGVFGGVTGSRHRRPRVAVPDARPERLPVGLRPGPDQRPAGQDDQLHDRLPDPGGAADHRPHDVQPRRGRRVADASRPLGRRRGRQQRCRAARLLPARAQLAAPAQPADEAARRCSGCCWRRSCCRRRSCRSSSSSSCWSLVRRACSELLRALRIPAVLFASILVVNALFFPGATDELVALGPLGVTREGLTSG